MYQVITIVVCFIKKLIIGLSNKHNLKKLEDPIQVPYQPPTSPEVQTLKARQKEIQLTIEEFNSPSTFAKYSKMQRQQIKLEKQIQQLTAKFQQENNINRSAELEKRAIQKKQRQQRRSSYVKRSWIIRIIVNFTLIRLVHGYFTFPIPHADQWPLSMFTNEDGRIKCSFLMAAGNILFNF